MRLLVALGCDARVRPYRRADMTTEAAASVDAVYDRLRNSRLSPAQRRIARYVIDHRDDAAFLTSDSIARQVGVSQPSVSRFAAALGYRRFADFKDALQKWARSEMTSFPPQTESAGPLEEAIGAEIANLQWLSKSAPLGDQIARVGAAIMSSERLPVIGLRVSRSFAQHFAYLGAKVHPGIAVIDRGDTEEKERIARARDQGATWCLAFILPRYPREACDLVRYAREIGLKVAVISDESYATVGHETDELITVRLASGLLFDTSAAVNITSSALLHAMADARPNSSQMGLERFERHAAELSVFED
ncbi:MurR/RpiR family transcriptional regulator [Pseudonocardia kujensis]|uniref:MurR/RpiR family transcriptional regulator n=1 Tax=Pseudonocardia kujensis TaxID=1128675 RepID=UPI001E481DD9|nr:MurR/RpiR family transcriptional regulator [Pseudonocardia kujensis]MCE0762498.1 MurR/RpiR family transcriptional regulator [Pseudonocardia kujensis]